MIRFFKALFNLIPFMYDFWGIIGAILAVICIIIVFAIIWFILYAVVFTIVTLTGHEMPRIRIAGKNRISRSLINAINRITSFIATIPEGLRGLPGAVKRLPETIKSVPANMEKNRAEKAAKLNEAEDYSHIKADVIDIEPEIPDLEDPAGALKKRPTKDAKDEARTIAKAISEAAKALNADDTKAEARAIAKAISEAAKALSAEEAKSEEKPGPVVEAAPTPVVERVSEPGPVIEPVVEPVAETTPEPDTEPVAEVAVKPETKAVPKSDTILITGSIPKPELILEPLTKISITDDHTFAYSYEVLNRCFGKDYKTYSRSVLHLNDEHTIRVWFPKIYTTVAAAEKAAATAKENVFAISKNGQNIHTVGKVTDDGDGIRFVFAKIGRKPYKFLGVFTKDLAKSKSDVLYFKQIEAEADFSRWSKED